MTRLDVTAVQGAIETAAAYPRQIHTSAAAAQAVALGPWVLAISCKYGQSDKNTFSERTEIDFTSLRTQLQSTLAAAEDQAGQFLGDFAFIRTWMAQTLPATSAAVASASAVVTTAMEALRSTGTLTPAQVTAVVTELEGLLGTLKTGSDELTSGMQGLAAFAASQQQYGTEVQDVAAHVSSAAQGYLTAVRNSLGSAPCGSGDGMRQLDAFAAQFTAASQSFETIFSGLASETTAAQQALSLLIGTVLSVDNDYRPVLTQVKQGQSSDIGSALQNLHLDIASREWATLAAYASQQLQAERQALATQLYAGMPMSTAPQILKAVAMAGSAAAATAQIDRVLADVYGPA